MFKLLFAAIELRIARNAMHKNPTMAALARFSKADCRYYNLRHGFTIGGM